MRCTRYDRCVARPETAIERTREVILEAAARVLGNRPDAGMAEIADEAGVGRATLYRYFPTRESLWRGVAETGANELADALSAANLDALPVDRAIARMTSVFLRTGAKYAALIGRMEEPPDEVAKERVVQPVRGVLTRGTRDGTFRADLPADVLFEMFGALLERALRLTVADLFTPEAAGDAVVTIFLDGARPG